MLTAHLPSGETALTGIDTTRRVFVDMSKTTDTNLPSTRSLKMNCVCGAVPSQCAIVASWKFQARVSVSGTKRLFSWASTTPQHRRVLFRGQTSFDIRLQQPWHTSRRHSTR